MAVDQTITLRLTIEDPIPGVAYSLQDAKNGPVGPLVAGDAPISLDVAVRVAPGPKFLVDFARTEGPTRRFVYLERAAIGMNRRPTPSSPRKRGPRGRTTSQSPWIPAFAGMTRWSIS